MLIRLILMYRARMATKVRTVTVTLPTEGIDEAVSIDLALSSTANEITGTEGPNIPPATGRSTPVLVIPSDRVLSGFGQNYEALNVARWLSVGTGEINANTGTQTFKATFSQPVSGLTTSNFSSALGADTAFRTDNPVEPDSPISGRSASWTIHTLHHQWHIKQVGDINS